MLRASSMWKLLLAITLTSGRRCWQDLLINFPNRPPPLSGGGHKLIGIRKAAAHGHAVERRGFDRQHRFAGETPAAQDGFDTAEAAIILNQLLRLIPIQHLVPLRALQRRKRIR